MKNLSETLRLFHTPLLLLLLGVFLIAFGEDILVQEFGRGFLTGVLFVGAAVLGAFSGKRPWSMKRACTFVSIIIPIFGVIELKFGGGIENPDMSTVAMYSLGGILSVQLLNYLWQRDQAKKS